MVDAVGAFKTELFSVLLKKLKDLENTDLENADFENTDLLKTTNVSKIL